MSFRGVVEGSTPPQVALLFPNLTEVGDDRPGYNHTPQPEGECFKCFSH
jgi:hypothetical protein